MDKPDLSIFSTEEIEKELERRNTNEYYVEKNIKYFIVDEVRVFKINILNIVENLQFPITIGKITSENVLVILNQAGRDFYTLYKENDFSKVIKSGGSSSTLQKIVLNKDQVISYLNNIFKK